MQSLVSIFVQLVRIQYAAGLRILVQLRSDPYCGFGAPLHVKGCVGQYQMRLCWVVRSKRANKVEASMTKNNKNGKI